MLFYSSTYQRKERDMITYHQTGGQFCQSLSLLIVQSHIMLSIVITIRFTQIRKKIKILKNDKKSPSCSYRS